MSATGTPTTLIPADMTRSDWLALEGTTVTLITADSVISGTFVRATQAGDAIIENATRTRTSGIYAGLVHHIARRRVWIGDVEAVTALGF